MQLATRPFPREDARSEPGLEPVPLADGSNGTSIGNGSRGWRQLLLARFCAQEEAC
jgi:hypothetical protein